MRKTIRMLSLAACWCCFFESMAQGYLPVVKENAEWTALKITTDTRIPPPPDPIDTAYMTTWIQGDTIIAGFTFKKVFGRQFSPGDNVPYYIAAVREENKIVTRIKKGESIARLDTLYNFNLQLGDTVAYYTAMSPFYFFVESIDSINLNDGISRKRFNISVQYTFRQEKAYTWVEGLGENRYGLIYPLCFEERDQNCFNKLICYKESGDIKYERSPLACRTTSIDTPMVFAPDGAEWIFNYSFAGNEGYQRISVQGDTIINSKNCRKLLWEKFFLNNATPEQDTVSVVEGYRYTHQVGDTILYYDDVKNQFTTLFTFNAQVGDTINVPFSGRHFLYSALSNSNFAFRVDSISAISIDGVEGIKRIETSPDCSATDVFLRTNTFIERIGTPSFLFFNEIDCYFLREDWSLRCYSDNEINYKVNERSCNLLTAAKEINNSPSLKIYPNPVSETLFIETEETIIHILIFDAHGKPVKKLETTSNISVADFPKGIYWLEALDKYKRRLGVSSFIVK